ncbi:MAG: 50S ribosomal protein L11 methyltransferase [Moheibacter sp.]
MNYIEYQFSISPTNPWREILVALLSEFEFESFSDTEDGLLAYVQAQYDDISKVEEQINSLEKVKINFTRKEIIQQNWNAEWESNFHPILVNDQCYIRAEFHESKPSIPYEIVIQPKMSFGTGHHETTHLMVEYILESEFKDKDVLDMGCGTSILAILTKMKGATYAEGIDIDEWAVDNSIENAERNAVEITARLGDASILGDKKFDTILANIQRNILLKDIPTYVNYLKSKNGELILSGLLEVDFEDIKNKCIENGLKFVSKKQRNEWIALKFKTT